MLPALMALRALGLFVRCVFFRVSIGFFGCLYMGFVFLLLRVVYSLVGILQGVYRILGFQGCRVLGF